ncbi:MAG TPA: cytochrome c biogenesis protein ResB [Dissulfurispiraceae bacterium]|nr:cytochrome c biogenesis protein ResB [Dissulfurispiraceae bacterium]
MSDEKKRGSSVVDAIWSALASIKLAIIVFSLLSLTSIVGTILEQQGDPDKNIKILANFFGSGAAKVYSVLDLLGFTDMYHAWWFIALLYLFAANLIVCSIERLPGIVKIVRQAIKPISAEQAASFSLRKEVVLKGKVEGIDSSVMAALGKEGFRPVRAGEGPDIQFMAEKGRYSRLGVYVTHLSILIIMTGALVGMRFGFNAHLNLLEGTQSAVAYVGDGKDIPLGFEIRCEDFAVDFYDKSDTPKSFKSWLTILENGKPVSIDGKSVTEIEVNTPLRYKGITFYQSSYGFTPNRDALFKFSVTGKTGKKQEVAIKFNETFTIPGTSIVGRVTDFSPAIAVDEQNRLYTYAETMNNPAVFVEFSDQGARKYQQWILKRYPETWAFPDGTVEFQDLWGVQYTGLQVRKDPGVGLVYLGCFVMAAGLYMAFFMSHNRIWVLLRQERSGTRVTIVGQAGKSRLALEGRIARIAQTLSAKSS